MAKKVGVVLSGCGVYDGAEIHEATITLLALDRAGAEIVGIAPNINQLHVVDHATGQPIEGASRNVMEESARILRGKPTDIADVKAEDLDALIFPGGFGAAKNLCTWAVDGPSMSVDADVDRLVKGMHAAKKPIGFLCIAPVIAAKVLGELGVKVTIGNDKDTAAGIESLGATHVHCPVDSIVVDDALKVVTTPAYMLGPAIKDVAAGIEKLVERVIELA